MQKNAFLSALSTDGCDHPPLPPDRVKYEKNKLITKCYGKNLKSYFKVPEIRGEIQVGGEGKNQFSKKNWEYTYTKN